MNTIPDTATLVSAMKEAHRAGLKVFGKQAVMAKKGKWSVEAQRQTYRDLVELGYLSVEGSSALLLADIL